MQSEAPKFVVDYRIEVPKLFDFRAVIPVAVRAEFLQALRDFAVEQKLEIDVRQSDAVRDFYKVDLRRDDIWIFGYNVFDRETFYVDAMSPLNGETPAGVSESLDRALRARLSQLPMLKFMPTDWTEEEKAAARRE